MMAPLIAMPASSEQLPAYLAPTRRGQPLGCSGIGSRLKRWCARCQHRVWDCSSAHCGGERWVSRSLRLVVSSCAGLRVLSSCYRQLSDGQPSQPAIATADGRARRVGVTACGGSGELHQRWLLHRVCHRWGGVHPLAIATRDRRAQPLAKRALLGNPSCAPRALCAAKR